MRGLAQLTYDVFATYKGIFDDWSMMSAIQLSDWVLRGREEGANRIHLQQEPTKCSAFTSMSTDGSDKCAIPFPTTSYEWITHFATICEEFGLQDHEENGDNVATLTSLGRDDCLEQHCTAALNSRARIEVN